MANLSKERRDRMIAKLEELKQQHNDDASIAALNEIENALREKKYGLVWEEHSEAVDDMLRENIPVLVADPERRLCKDESLPWNFIIEGDNLQALYLLEKTHRGKVDCIYIDPPYNTGARDWKYNNDYVDGNDQYRHSKWLSMMRSRLLIAKRILNPRDSVLIVTIDEKEYLHLGCMLEELFPEARMQMVSSVINPTGTQRPDAFNRTDEYIFFLRFGVCTITPMVSMSDEPIEVDWRTFRRQGSDNLRPTRPNQFYAIYVNDATKTIVKVGEPLQPEVDRNSVDTIPGCTAVFPIKDDGTEMMWSTEPDETRRRLSKGYIRVGKSTPDKPQKYILQYLYSGKILDIESGKATIIGKNADGSIKAVYANGREIMPTTQWNNPSHNAQTNGSILLKRVLGENRFSFPKSLYAVADCIRFFVANKPNAVIVDFFAGSGTTMHAVNLLNAEDNGQRRCIIITNNEVSEAEARSMLELGLTPGTQEWEGLGIARHVTWPRMVCSIEGHDTNGLPLKGNYLGSNIPMSDGFQANVKFFRCGWTPRKPEEYLLSNALCLHVKELIELQTAEEVDGVKNALVLSKSDYRRIFEDPDIAAKVENVWVNENLVFGAAEMRLLKAKKFRYIPREFFSQELKEVGEYV